MTVSVHNVAAYIISKLGKQITTWQLHKLLYYSQAWSLVWDEKPLFRARIEAWENSPVIPRIYARQKRQFWICQWPYGDANKLNPTQKETVDAVIKYYGGRTGSELGDLIRQEEPWREARYRFERHKGNNAITLESLDRYYSSIPK